MQVSPKNPLGTATLSEYFRSCFHVMHYVTFIFLEIIDVMITVAYCMSSSCSFAAALRTTACWLASQHLSWSDRLDVRFYWCQLIVCIKSRCRSDMCTPVICVSPKSANTDQTQFRHDFFKVATLETIYLQLSHFPQSEL